MLNQHNNPHFENEQDIHITYENDVKIGYNLDLDLLAILY